MKKIKNKFAEEFEKELKTLTKSELLELLDIIQKIKAKRR